MRRATRILAVVVAVVAVAILIGYFWMVSMPGHSYETDVPQLTEPQQQTADRLQADVRMLAEEIGPRHVGAPRGLEQSVEFLEQHLEKLGYEPDRISFDTEGVECHNIEVELEGTDEPDEIVVIGAHYDSFRDTPAANDNASGVAATLELARRFADRRPQRTLRFVFFVNEEPPWFQTAKMGSWVYAKRARQRGDDIVHMVSLETIGYFDDTPNSQSYPVGALRWFYPDQGNFIGFVGNLGSRKSLRSAIGAFREVAEVPSEGASLPGFIPGVGWSDHWAFWEHGYPGVMVTDTAMFRYPYYHTDRDTPEKLNYWRMALLVDGLEESVEALVER